MCGLDFSRDIGTVNLDELGNLMRHRDVKKLDVDYRNLLNGL